MSGESTRSGIASAAAFERAFGDSARCNRCGSVTPEYRVLAVFLHDTVAMRAYCQPCYDVAIEGEYHAGGDGFILHYEEFTKRFGAAGPPPPPCTPVDQVLSALIRDPALRSLKPPSEALARRTRKTPYKFQVEIDDGKGPHRFELDLTPNGTIYKTDLHSPAADWLARLFG
ncbi:MAG TPA: hypothetical protein VFQ05_16405 [Candidatus Eisenbacteria bacterium]|nr:hypothetical protein [Candidatus Eisenbacteria bacterium]